MVGLIVNIILNLILINTNGAFGAAIATTVSQFVVVLVQMYYVRDEISLSKAIKSGKKYFIASSVMLVICLGLGLVIKNDIASVAVKVIVGAIVYFIMLVALGDKYVYEVRDMVMAKLKKQ